MRLRRLHLGLLAVLSTVYICSCAVNHVAPPARPARISPALASPERRPAPKPVFNAGAVVSEAQDDISKGRYEEAFNLYREALNAHPGNRKLVSGYDTGLHTVRKIADMAFEKTDCAAAGGLYRLLVRDAHPAAPAEDGRLRERIGYCSRTLTERGLASYRKGDLQMAIASWDSVLKFDPDNAEVRKALDTARIQLKNLSK